MNHQEESSSPPGTPTISIRINNVSKTLGNGIVYEYYRIISTPSALLNVVHIVVAITICVSCHTS